MSRDLWQTVREAVEIDRINKKLSISNNSFQCGPINASFVSRSSVSSLRSPLYGSGQDLTISATKITIDFYLKAFPTVGQTSWYLLKLLEASGYGITVQLTPDYITVNIITSASTYSTSLTPKYGQWARYTVAVDTAANQASVYINGVLAGNITVTSGSFSTNTFALVFGNSEFLCYLNGNLNDVAIYNVRKDATAVSVLNTHKGSTGTYSSGLVYFWTLRETQNADVGAVNLTGTAGGSPTYDEDDYPFIGYGSSFVLAEYAVTVDNPTSLLFPNSPPDASCNGMLVVRWLDDNGDLQRRKLWDMEGVIINPAPAAYNGERLPASFTLELWNIDGADTVNTGGAITLSYADTTAPTSSYDRTQSATALTEDTTIQQNFPLTPFPLTFSDTDFTP